MAQSELFGKLPSNAASDIEEYNLHIPDSEIQHMQDLLKLTPVAEPIHENSLPDGDRHLGLRRDWLVEAKRVWETDFEWQVTRVASSRTSNLSSGGIPKIVSTLSQTSRRPSTISSESSTFISQHFSHVDPTQSPSFYFTDGPALSSSFSLCSIYSGRNTRLTLCRTTSWVPSLPGFTLSSGPSISHDMSQVDVARIMDSLMRQIGFGDAYVAQGGDVGSRVARMMAVDHDACKGEKFPQLSRLL